MPTPAIVEDPATHTTMVTVDVEGDGAVSATKDDSSVPVGSDGDAEATAATVRAELTALAQPLGSSLP